MDSVLSSEFKAALKHHTGTVVASCRGSELLLQQKSLVTKLRMTQRTADDYAFVLPVQTTLEQFPGQPFFRFELRDHAVVVAESSLRFEQTNVPEPLPALERKAVVRGEDLEPLGGLQFVGKEVTTALELTSEGTSLILTDGFSLHHIGLSISPGDEQLVSATFPEFGLFKRGAVEVLRNDKTVVLKQGGLELYLERKGKAPDYKGVLSSLNLFGQVTVPVEPIKNILQPLKRDKKKQVTLTVREGRLELDGTFITNVRQCQPLTLMVLATLLYDALPVTDKAELLLTGNSTPFVVRSRQRWTLVVPIPAKEVVKGSSERLSDVLTGVTLARAA
jgi:hypothetical protein